MDFSFLAGVNFVIGQWRLTTMYINLHEEIVPRKIPKFLKRNKIGK